MNRKKRITTSHEQNYHLRQNQNETLYVERVDKWIKDGLNTSGQHAFKRIYLRYIPSSYTSPFHPFPPSLFLIHINKFFILFKKIRKLRF